MSTAGEADGAGVLCTADVIEAWWREAHDRIVDALRAAGADADGAEEATAEAITRALARGLVVRDVDEFCRWAYVVARNVVIDAGRRSRRLELLDALPERPDPCDVAAHVETRQRLRLAQSVLGEMSATDRQALLSVVDGSERTTSRKEAVALAVRRHRARARLREALGAPIGWVAACRHRGHRWLARLWSTQPERWSAAAIPVLVVSTAWLVAAAPPRHLGVPQAAAVSIPARAAVPVAGPTPRVVAAVPRLAHAASLPRTGAGQGGPPPPGNKAPSHIKVDPGSARTGMRFSVPIGPLPVDAAGTLSPVLGAISQ